MHSFTVPEVHLVVRFTLLGAPVQADGSVAGKPFYFRSKYDEWTFAIALDGGDPVMIEAGNPGFFRSEPYEDASYMPVDEATAILIRCAREFLGQHPELVPPSRPPLP